MKIKWKKLGVDIAWLISAPLWAPLAVVGVIVLRLWEAFQKNYTQD